MRHADKAGQPVVYVIQKSNKYGLKQDEFHHKVVVEVVYVIQKSNKYGLKQEYHRTLHGA